MNLPHGGTASAWFPVSGGSNAEAGRAVAKAAASLGSADSQPHGTLAPARREVALTGGFVLVTNILQTATGQ